MYVFLGSDSFALQVLEGLYEKVPPLAVVTQPDRPSGRKQKVKPGPLAKFAIDKNIPLFQPDSLREEESQEQLLSYEAKLFIVVSFGQILPESLILKSPPIINGHASLLPKYRGASPIQAALLSGDRDTGMTIMHIVKALDAGPMISYEKIEIEDDDNHASLSSKLAESCIRLLEPFAAGEEVPAGKAQNHRLASYCGKIKKEDLQLYPHQEEARSIFLKVRAYGPKPGAFLFVQSEKGPQRLKLLKVKISNEWVEEGHFLIQEKKMYLGCKTGTLEIFRVQPEGKAAMPIQDFLNGWKSSLRLDLDAQ